MGHRLGMLNNPKVLTVNIFRRNAVQPGRMNRHRMGSNRIAQLEQFLSEDPDDTFVLFALAKEHASLNNIEESRKYFARLRATDPDYVGLYYHLGKLEERAGNTAAAEAAYRDGMETARRMGDGHALSELQGALESLKV